MSTQPHELDPVPQHLLTLGRIFLSDFCHVMKVAT